MTYSVTINVRQNIKANNTFTTTIDLSKIDVENELLKAQQLLKEKK